MRMYEAIGRVAGAGGSRRRCDNKEVARQTCQRAKIIIKIFQKRRNNLYVFFFVYLLFFSNFDEESNHGISEPVAENDGRGAAEPDG